MSEHSKNVLFSIFRGLLFAVVLTLLGMLVIAALAVFARLSDSLLAALNQILKIVSIVLGVRAAVGRGGRNGFVTGAVISLLYAILGYALCVGLGGFVHSTVQMLGEILLCAAIGSMTGAILANLSPKSHRRSR